jgi:hypothetical protein
MRRKILTKILTGPHSVASYDKQRDAEDLFLPGPLRIYPDFKEEKGTINE